MLRFLFYVTVAHLTCYCTPSTARCPRGSTFAGPTRHWYETLAPPVGTSFVRESEAGTEEQTPGERRRERGASVRPWWSVPPCRPSPPAPARKDEPEEKTNGAAEGKNTARGGGGGRARRRHLHAGRRRGGGGAGPGTGTCVHQRRHIDRSGDRVRPDAGGSSAHLPDPPAGCLVALRALLDADS